LSEKLNRKQMLNQLYYGALGGSCFGAVFSLLWVLGELDIRLSVEDIVWVLVVVMLGVFAFAWGVYKALRR